ncbi:MAG: HAD hydrolase family protein [Flavobacteriales bacterium]|nr:HAD hydrolase family protein [Bacteroidota bacterium]MCB9240100.1 HAD hydrolase family protein [Flavobacteriales bacterium]
MNLESLKELKALVLDVDGVLTDANVLVTEDGKLLRTMSIRDGYALKRAMESGLEIIVISGGTSEGVRTRLHNLGVKHVYLGVQNKDEVLKRALNEVGIQSSHVMAMGDDLPDLKLFEHVAFKAAPSDAVPEIIQEANYVSARKGGDGCVREVIELILRAKNAW